MEYAEKYNSVIKLIARTKKSSDGKVSAAVSPCFVSNENQLSNVEGVFNGVLLNGNAVGECMFYGSGAGKLPTASAVVADVIDAANHSSHIKNLFYKKSEENFILPYEETSEKFFIRMRTSDLSQAEKICKDLFGKYEKIYNLFISK